MSHLFNKRELNDSKNFMDYSGFFFFVKISLNDFSVLAEMSSNPNIYHRMIIKKVYLKKSRFVRRQVQMTGVELR